MKLVLAEKPSVAQSIAKVLGAAKREDGYLEGNGYVVSWCVGHLVELAQPEAYDAKYSKQYFVFHLRGNIIRANYHHSTTAKDIVAHTACGFPFFGNVLCKKLRKHHGGTNGQIPKRSMALSNRYRSDELPTDK